MEAPEVREVRHESGALLLRAEVRGEKFHGKYLEWALNGTLVVEANFECGELHGPYKSWWDTGIPKEQGEFRHGKRIGTYRWYQLSGELWQVHTYEDAA